MADSPKLIVLKKLTDFLKGITPAAGYDYDLSDGPQEHVFRGRSLFGANDPMLMLSIIESPAPGFSTYGGEQDYGGGQVRSDRWVLLMQGTAVEDPVHPSDSAYNFMWAVEDRLAAITAVTRGGFEKPIDPANYLLGKTIASFQSGPGIVRPPVLGAASRSYFFLPMTLVLASDVG